MERYGSANVVVVLGSPDAESAEIFAESVVNGDPTYAGPLTATNLQLPVFHVLESEIRDAADAGVYEESVGLMAEVLEPDVIEAVRRVREGMS